MRSIFHLCAVLVIVGCLAQCSSDTDAKVTPVLNFDDSVPMSFTLSAEQVTDSCNREKNELTSKIAALVSAPGEATFENTVLPLEIASTRFFNALNPVTFLKYVSTDADVRAAADVCETDVSQLMVELYVREDVYSRVREVEARAANLPASQRQLLEETLSAFKRNGLELPPDQRQIYVEKKKLLVKLEAEFSTNLNEYQDELAVTQEQLDGLSAGFIQGLKKDDQGRYLITMSYPHYYGFMENAKNAEARRLLEFKFSRRGGEKNRDLLQQAVGLRRELAKMLGYPNHAAFVLERRMARTPEQASKFVSDLVTRLKPKGQENLDDLLALKKQDEPAADRINAWDWRYYEAQLKKQKHQIDQQLVKEYFPLDVVTAGMFEIYQKLLGVEFQAVEIPRWNASVLAYKVVSEGKTVAYFYMDLFPREGKYGHAAAFTILSGYQQADGKYRAPVSSIVANFNPPVAGMPSLLEHSEVETLFHEFGHIMHQVLTRAQYATFSGTSVMRDFVEAPSQMLENWVWENEALQKLSGHYLDHSKKLPSDMVQKLIGAKLVNSGIRYLRQAAFATLDLQYHTEENVDTTAVYAKAMADVMLVPLQEDTYPEASFGHLMGGYDAGYYGYLWSEVYAQDMFTRFAKEGLLNPETGGAYRHWILEPGGTSDPFKLISGFLGREPNQDAFLKSLGL